MPYDHDGPMGFYWEIEYIPGPYSRSLGKQREVEIVHNAINNEGQRAILNTFFRNTDIPPAFYVGLHSGTDVTTKVATLANVVEPSQLGYARKLLNRNTTDWGIPALDVGDYQIQGSTVTFVSAQTSWLQVNQMFLASQAAGGIGAIILAANLQTVRILASQDTLNVTPKEKVQ